MSQTYIEESLEDTVSKSHKHELECPLYKWYVASMLQNPNVPVENQLPQRAPVLPLALGWAVDGQTPRLASVGTI